MPPATDTRPRIKAADATEEINEHRVGRGAGIRVACLVLHFLLVLTLSCRETLWLIARGYTILPASLEPPCAEAERVISGAFGQRLSDENPVREAVNCYLHLAGIETGYGYFAPNVPNSNKLVFELHYPSGQIDYEVAGAESEESTLRISTLLDELGRTSSDPLREVMMKFLARSVWRRHPAATEIRTILGSRTLPSVEEFEQGQRESYEFLWAYDFSLAEPGE